jgi:hypothetical protein
MLLLCARSLYSLLIRTGRSTLVLRHPVVGASLRPACGEKLLLSFPQILDLPLTGLVLCDAGFGKKTMPLD